MRVFLYSDDLAEACVFLLGNADYQDLAFEDSKGTTHSHVNIGSSEEISIPELAFIVSDVVGFEGEIGRDTSKPDGTPRKLLDSTRINMLGWRPRVRLKEGTGLGYADWLRG